MPVMNRKCGKAQRIFEDIMGTPPNQHRALKRNPRISEVDIQKTLLALGMGGMPGPGLNDQQGGSNNMMPQSSGLM